MSRSRELLLVWFDKAVLGVVALVTAVVVVTTFGSDDSLARAATDIAVMTEKVQRLAAMQSPRPAVEPGLAALLRARVAVADVPTGATYPAWSMSARPYVVTVFPSIERGPEPVHKAPGDLRATAERGRITVRWTENPTNRYIEVQGYEIARRTADAAEWTTIGRAESDKTELVDTSVAARKAYFYRVVSVAKESASARKPQPLAPEARIRTAEMTEPVETPRDLFIVPQFVEVPDLVAQPGGVKRARVVVHRWDAAAAGWERPRSYFVAVGDEIGDQGDPPTGTRARFTTGAVLIDCGSEMRKRARGGIEVGWEYRFVLVRFADGSEERFDNADVPEDLGKPGR